MSNQTSNVVSILALKKIKSSHYEDSAYEARVLGMDKFQLLEEMVRFQEERSQLGELTPSMMVRGKVLFKSLEDTAETRELRLLTRAYRRHLECELQDYLKNPLKKRAD